jgi:hypothetical protein
MSTLKIDTILHSDGTQTTEPSIPALDQRMAKAWVNFNGTGTVAIRRAFNVSSITDNGAGSYTVNFTTAMPDANYAPAYGGGDNALGGTYDYITGTYQTNAGSLRVITYARSTGATVDPTLVSVTIFS